MEGLSGGGGGGGGGSDITLSLVDKSACHLFG